ncbi:hypothetical protein GCM10017559_66120 [Streptosporangium longisporum]|uniref:Uncharacterized protein n=1 Tax=Streptosporangium longisporum TaxID=46187 RepID=A0ABP6L4A3_9ACTN
MTFEGMTAVRAALTGAMAAAGIPLPSASAKMPADIAARTRLLPPAPATAVAPRRCPDPLPVCQTVL